MVKRSALFACAILAAVCIVWAFAMKNTKSDKATARIPIYDTLTGSVRMQDTVVKTDAEWKKILTPEQFRVTRTKGTEAPFSGSCATGRAGGIYRCVCCGTDLFAVRAKFESGTGWPSFGEPVSDLNILSREDTSLGMRRTEVACTRCGAHLGHVFDDGPRPTCLRYCTNAAALVFTPVTKPPRLPEHALFAAGCFWGVEAVFRGCKGVIAVTVGYSGGTHSNPTYEDVCTGKTGHAETARIEYDPSVVSYRELLDAFWKMHDPTTLNRQGPDAGTQYRSAIFYYTDDQRRAAEASKQTLAATGPFKDAIVTEITPAGPFYPAEEYHQRYFEKHGGGAACHGGSAT